MSSEDLSLTVSELRALSFDQIDKAKGGPEGHRLQAATLAVAYAALAQTATREPVRIPVPLTPHPQGAEAHPEDDGVDYTLDYAVGEPPEPIPDGGRRVMANDPLRSGLVVDHPFISMRVNGVDTCRSCSYNRFDHVSEVDEHGNEQPVHVAVPRAVLAGVARVVEWAIQGEHYTLDGLAEQRDVKDAIDWMRSNV